MIQAPPVPTVYVIDDDLHARESVTELVAAWNFRVNSFESAPAFLRHDELSKVGCVVTDLRMPEMTGLELQQELKTTGIDLPLIIISAYIGVPDTVTAMHDGAISVLPKPYGQQQLWEEIKRGLALSADRYTRSHRKQEVAALFSKLSDSEVEVLDFVADGLPNKAVANRLRTPTLSNHAETWRHKLCRTHEFAERVSLS